MRRLLYISVALSLVGLVVVLAGAFLIHALVVMEKASSAPTEAIARFGTPLGEIGTAIGWVFAGLGVLLVCARHALQPLRGQHQALPNNRVERTSPSPVEHPKLSLGWLICIATAVLVLLAMSAIAVVYYLGPFDIAWSPSASKPRLGPPVDYNPFAIERPQKAPQ